MAARRRFKSSIQSVGGMCSCDGKVLLDLAFCKWCHIQSSHGQTLKQNIIECIHRTPTNRIALALTIIYVCHLCVCFLFADDTHWPKLIFFYTFFITLISSDWFCDFAPPFIGLPYIGCFTKIGRNVWPYTFLSTQYHPNTHSTNL